MRKQIASLLVLLILLAGCSRQPNPNLPAHDYPLSKELVEAAIGQCGLPGDLSVEVNDLVKYEGIESTSYTLRHPTKDVFAGCCLGILTHKAEAFTSLGIILSTIDQMEETTQEEIRQTIRYAAYLFWGEEDPGIESAFFKQYTQGQPLVWEKKIDGIDCRLVYNPNARQGQFQIAFSTDMKTQLNYNP